MKKPALVLMFALVLGPASAGKAWAVWPPSTSEEPGKRAFEKRLRKAIEGIEQGERRLQGALEELEKCEEDFKRLLIESGVERKTTEEDLSNEHERRVPISREGVLK